MYSTVDEVKSNIRDDYFDALLDPDLEDAERQGEVETIVESAILDADGTIDGYLSTRYPVPLASPDKMINNLSKDIAIYNIFSRIGINEDDRENTLITRYKNAIRFLEKIAEGKISLPEKRSQQSAKPASIVSIQSSQRVFSRDSLKGM